jgi:hypothetical protein
MLPARINETIAQRATCKKCKAPQGLFREIEHML